MNQGRDGPNRLHGPSASPYVAKMRALPRYRRIPFAWIPAALDWPPGHLEIHPDMAGVTPTIVPMLRYPDGAVEALAGEAPFLLGSRPSLGDFGLFGALYTLWRDPTPARIMARAWPASVWWVRSLDDGSGIEGDWLADGADPPQATVRLPRLCGEIYLPFLAANEAAFEAGEDWVRLEAAGLPYARATFRYQVKCLGWLRAEFAALPDDARARLEPLLAETGCLAPLGG